MSVAERTAQLDEAERAQEQMLAEICRLLLANGSTEAEADDEIAELRRRPELVLAKARRLVAAVVDFCSDE